MQMDHTRKMNSLNSYTNTSLSTSLIVITAISVLLYCAGGLIVFPQLPGIADWGWSVAYLGQYPLVARAILLIAIGVMTAKAMHSQPGRVRCYVDKIRQKLLRSRYWYLWVV